MSLARAFPQSQNPSKLTWQLLNISFLQTGVQTQGRRGGVSVFSLPPEKNKKSQSQNRCFETSVPHNMKQVLKRENTPEKT